VWGSDEVNVEGWKPLKRLPGHESGRLHLNYHRTVINAISSFKISLTLLGHPETDIWPQLDSILRFSFGAVIHLVSGLHLENIKMKTQTAFKRSITGVRFAPRFCEGCLLGSCRRVSRHSV
jgi:hypothetical protein